jgi:hypothetical protein
MPKADLSGKAAVFINIFANYTQDFFITSILSNLVVLVFLLERLSSGIISS